MLGDRYTTTLRLSEGAHHERWRASDHVLDRHVVLVCFPSDSPVAAAALDAARQAAGVEDARLVRVLDVGIDGPISFVVEEPLTGAVSFAQLVARDGLPATEVRRLVGEAAQALDRAGKRGLHHLALSPNSLLRLPTGDVKLRGLATDAALTDTAHASEERAARLDAVGLVRLAYAGLTGRWPKDFDADVDHGEGLPLAPVVVGGFAAPAEIAAGVPNDLDLICRLTLNEESGPPSPGDLAAQIAPWPAGPPTSDGVGGARLSSTRTETDATRTLAAVPGSATQLYERLTSSTNPTEAINVQPGTTIPAGPKTGVIATAGALGSKVGTMARSAAERTSAMRARRRAEHDHFRGEDVALTEALEESEEDLAPPVPLLGHAAPERPSGAQTRIALAIVGALVLVALVVGIQNVAKIGTSDRPAVAVPPPVASPSPSPTAEPSEEPSATATEEPTPTTTTTTTAAPEPIAVVAGTGFDPEDDNTESDRRAPLAFDGNPDTVWTSRWYGTQTYNGAKSGVGLVLDLDKEATVREVDVVLPAAQDVSVYAATEASLDSAQLVGEVSGQSGTITFIAPEDMRPATKVIVWVTLPAPAEEPDHYRAQVSEVVVR